MKPQSRFIPLSFAFRGAVLSGMVAGPALILGAFAAHAQTELIRNGGFDEVLVGWSSPPALAGESFFVPEGEGGYVKLDTDVMGYSGVVLRQPLNVPGVAGQTVHASVGLTAKSEWAPEGRTVAFSVEFLRNDGSLARAIMINPDNSQLVSPYFVTIQADYTFPADAKRLIGVTLERIGGGFGTFYADDVSLTSPVAPHALPGIDSVSATRVAYGDSVEIRGRDFLAVGGTVLLGGSGAGIQVKGWSDTLIEFSVNDPCAGGPLEVITSEGVRVGGVIDIGITSPHFTATRFVAPSFEGGRDIPIVIPGQPVFVDVDVTCCNHCAPAGGIGFSVPDAPSATPYPGNIAADGGSHIEIDTNGLGPGFHTFTVTASAAGFADRTFPFTVDVRSPGILSLQYQDADSREWFDAPNPLPFVSQKPVPIRAVLLDSEGADISEFVDLFFTICNPAVIQVWNSDTPWDDSVAMPQGDGSCVITAHAPGGRTWAFPVTVTIPEAPRIVSYTITPTGAVIDNSGSSTFILSVTSTKRMSQFSLNHSANIIDSVDGDFSDDGKTYTGTYKVKEDVKPGDCKLTVTADMEGGGASQAKFLHVVNTPGTGMISGHQALIRNPSQMQGASGTVEFWDAASGAKAFEKELPGNVTWDYLLVNIPPGTYKLLWKMEEGPGYAVPQWFSNAYDHADALEVVVSGGGIAANANFFLDLIPDALSPAPPASDPAYNPGEKKFQCSAATENGFTYELWKSTTGASGTWYKVDGQEGNGQNITLGDDGATGTRGFYKVIRK